jgi:hypothetical protein
MVLRSVDIGKWPLWADESLTAILVRYPWWSFPFTSVDATPPLFYWLEKAFVPEGAGPAAWRVASLVAGVATIPLTYWLGRELQSRTAGLVAAGLVAVSAALVDYAQEARAYSLAVAMIAGSAAALAALTGGRFAGRERRRARRWILAVFALFTILAAFSHFIAIFWILPALLLFRLAADGDQRTITPREFIATMLCIIPFLLIELRREFVFRSEQDSFSWLAQLPITRLFQILAEQWLPFAKLAGWAVALVELAALIALLWAVKSPLSAWARGRRLQAGILAALLLEPIGLWLFGELLAPVAMPRTFLPAAIGSAALIGIMIGSLQPPARLGIGAAVVVLGLGSTLAEGTTRRKEDWAGAAAAARGAPVVVTCANWKTPSFLAQAKGVGWVVTSYGSRAMIVRQPGDTATWDRLYFERVQSFAHYPLHRDHAPSLESRQIVADRVLFVASACSDVERRAFATWAGLRTPRLLWSSPPVEDAAEIRVEEWRLDGRRRLNAWIVG